MYAYNKQKRMRGLIPDIKTYYETSKWLLWGVIRKIHGGLKKKELCILLDTSSFIIFFNFF